jgi:hypothetical protein
MANDGGCQMMPDALTRLTHFLIWAPTRARIAVSRVRCVRSVSASAPNPTLHASLGHKILAPAPTFKCAGPSGSPTVYGLTERLTSPATIFENRVTKMQVSFAEYGRRHAVSRQTVNRWRQAGRLKITRRGLVDVRASDERLISADERTRSRGRGARVAVGAISTR